MKTALPERVTDEHGRTLRRAILLRQKNGDEGSSGKLA